MVRECICRPNEQCPFERDCSVVGLKECTSTGENPPLVVPFPQRKVHNTEPPRCYCSKGCKCADKKRGMDTQGETKSSKNNRTNTIRRSIQDEQSKFNEEETGKKKNVLETMESEPNESNGQTARRNSKRISEKVSAIIIEKPKEKKAKRVYNSAEKKRDDLVLKYLEGMYPGVHVGHRECVEPRILVPSTMGWLWNLEDNGSGLAPRRGWRPGAIDKFIMRLIRRAKRAAGISVDMPVISGKKKMRSRPVSKRVSKPVSKESEKIHPTLLLQKTKGKYHVAMNPRILKDDDLVDVQKPLEINIVPKPGDSDSGSSDSSLEVQLICPNALPQEHTEDKGNEENSELEDVESKPKVTSSTEKKKLKKGK